MFHCPNVPSSPYYFYHYLKGVNPFSVAALKYSSQASRPCPPANTTDPRVPSLDVAGLFPTIHLSRLSNCSVETRRLSAEKRIFSTVSGR
jgi:hypothetical protein